VTTRWRFGPVAEPVEITGCTGLLEPVSRCLHGWPLAPWAPESTDDPAIAITTRETEFVLTSRFIAGEETYADAPSIVCAFMAELIMAYGATQRDNLFLHAGGAVVEDRMMVFPARGRAGKSTLVAQLAQRGARIFSDDVVPLDIATLRGRALGIEPRLRLPLPESLSATMHGWVEAHRRLFNRKITYVGLPRQGPGALAPLGEERPIDAIVLLAREPGARPTLEPCSRADVLKQLVHQHFGGPVTAVTLIARFKALVESAPCYRLRYDGGEEAPDLLHRMARAA